MIAAKIILVICATSYIICLCGIIHSVNKAYKHSEEMCDDISKELKKCKGIIREGREEIEADYKQNDLTLEKKDGRGTLKNRNMPKMPTYKEVKSSWFKIAHCPTCGAQLSPDNIHKPNYCESCGQAIKWE